MLLMADVSLASAQGQSDTPGGSVDMARPTNRPDNKRSHLPGVTSRLMTPKDVAEYLNITESQVYTLMREGDLLALKIGKRGVWRVDREELEQYIERLKAEARSRVGSPSRKKKGTQKAKPKK
jgi:excisionase family DNA binding protein